MSCVFSKISTGKKYSPSAAGVLWAGSLQAEPPAFPQDLTSVNIKALLHAWPEDRLFFVKVDVHLKQERTLSVSGTLLLCPADLRIEPGQF